LNVINCSLRENQGTEHVLETIVTQKNITKHSFGSSIQPG